MDRRPRCKTGIEVLDKELNRGIVQGGNIILVSGEAGVGKTTLSMEFLTTGARMDDKEVFFTVTETISKIKNIMNLTIFLMKNLSNQGN